MDSAEGTECYCAERRTCSSGCTLSFLNFNELGCGDPFISRCRSRGCSDGFCRRCWVPLQSTEVQGAVCATMDPAEGAGCHCRVPRCRAPYVHQWMYSLSFPNFNELSSRDPPISRYRRRGCSDESCRKCRVPLQSTEVQGAVYTTMDPVQGAGCFCWILPCRAASKKLLIYSFQFVTCSNFAVHLDVPSTSGINCTLSLPKWCSGLPFRFLLLKTI